MADEITLTVPCEAEFTGVAHLVLGGLAARLDLTVEHLEDLQIALDGLFERRPGSGSVTVAVTVDDGLLRTAVGPFEASALDDLERDDGALGLRRILETVCDTVELEERNGHRWVQLTKRTAES
jgi:anti-sigma regulatory factor (Ser/Thr protein kinase)